MKNVSAVMLAIVLSGCASTYHLPSNQASAMLSFDVSNDSTGTTGRHYAVEIYEDLSCKESKYGTRLAGKMFAGDREQIGPVSVAAGTPLTFAMAYIESRFAQNRGCTFTATFSPAPEETYAVRFAVVNESLACGIQITDRAGAAVPYQVPEISCSETLAGRTKNGGAGILNWKFTVQTTR